MAGSKMSRDTLPETFDTFEEMAEFWDKHDITDYAEYLTEVEATVSAHPKHEYVITLSDSLDALLNRVQRIEGVPLNTLVNLWVQEKLQEYGVALSS
jgi:hypothetical protein